MTTPDRSPSATRWTPQQLGDFVDQVRDDRFFALWMLIATTGIRVETLVDLRRGDVDLQEPRLSARPAAVGSDTTCLSVARTFALDPDTHEALREHVIDWDKSREGQRSDHLFVLSDGKPIHPKSVEILFRGHCQKANLPVVSLKAARAAYVVAAIETGIPTAVISERLGRPDKPRISPSTRPDTPSRRRPCHLRSL